VGHKRRLVRAIAVKRWSLVEVEDEKVPSEVAVVTEADVGIESNRTQTDYL